MEHFNAVKEKLDARLAKYPQIVQLEESVGIEKFYIAAMLFVGIGSIIYLLGGAVLIVNLIGFIYPAYQSFKALNSPKPDDDTQWLTYWVVYAFFNLTENLTSIFMKWIPFYFVIKVAFLIWCIYPGTLVRFCILLLNSFYAMVGCEYHLP